MIKIAQSRPNGGVGSIMNERASVPVRVRRVSGELRDLRKKSGLSAEEVSAALGFSMTKLSRMENARRGLDADDVSALLGFYRVPTQRRGELLDSVRQGTDRNWWHTRQDRIPQEWQDFQYFEARATSIENFETTFVPGLLQIPEYTAALVSGLSMGAPCPDIDVVVRNRAQRQAEWQRRGRPRVRVFLEEAVCQRVVGGREVMRRQLQHLAYLSETDTISLRVVPFSLGPHPASDGVFVLLRFDGEPSLLYVEYRDGCTFYEESRHVRAAAETVSWLRENALTRAESVRLVQDHADRLV